ncbi:ftsH extracellular protease family [Wolffia australiana]
MDLAMNSPFCNATRAISTSRDRYFTRIALPTLHKGTKFPRYQFRCGFFSEAASPVNPTLKTNVVEVGKNLAKPLALALFCAAVGFLPLPLQRNRVLAAPAATVASKNEEKGKSMLEHEFSSYTERLLESVSVFLQRIEDVKSKKGNLGDVEQALREVKARRKEVQREVLDGLNSELSMMRKTKLELVKRSGEVLDAALATGKERDRLLEKGAADFETKEKLGSLESKINLADEEYNSLWEKIGEIDDTMLKKETLTYSIAIREFSFIERESELLLERFRLWLRQEASESQVKIPKQLSPLEVKKDLEAVQRSYVEEIVLPSVIEVEDAEPFVDQSTRKFVSNVRKAFKKSEELQRNLEDRIRKKMKGYGAEKRYLVYSPDEETVKGFPDIELKWMFGRKEVAIPKAIRLHLFHGWKKWREEAKSDLKRKLIEDEDYRNDYIKLRQERTLLDRDRVVERSWFNQEKNRWELDPIALPYAVSKKLIEYARIRHDWGAMLVGLKGDDKEYFVDIKEFELLFDDFGGFDGLYIRMLASGVPTSVQLMWIPFTELDLRQQFVLSSKLLNQSLVGLWKTSVVSYARNWAYKKIKDTTDDIMMIIGFPLVEFIIPKRIRMSLGMAWPEEVDQFVGSTWYLKWQSEAELNFKSHKGSGLWWYIGFLFRSIIFGFVVFHVLRFMRKIPRALGYGPFRRDPNLRKLRRVRFYHQFRLNRRIRRRKEGVDPIKSAFEQMKRVKNPPIRLDEFSSIDSMREEINEIVAFLRNPAAFQEMGARAPRGVLIVGERGTGKTSLALAIAAQARVPVVEIKARQLEAGLWVGQSASNVRELFQTARDLAPVIIFVEDFDLFAGVRGQFIHTKKQDHEAFINQLLVELDGFEKQDGVVLLATTRNLKQIDQALQRPGRMDRVLHLQRPTQMEREKILKISARETMDEQLIGFVDWKKVAEKTALLRPVELQLVPLALEGAAFRNKVLDTDELMSYCGWFASLSRNFPKWLRDIPPIKGVSRWLVNHLGLGLTKEDIQSVVDLMEPYGQISNGIELLSPPLEWSRETKLPHAIWAAGRGLIALLLPNFDVVDNIWLEPTSWEGIGCTKITKARNEGSMNGNVETRSYLEKKLVFCFGSHIASQLLLPFGEENFLSSSELKQAQEIATRMVIQYGWGPDDSPTIYFCNNAVTAMSMGNMHEFEMAEKVEKMYNAAYEKAKEMLVKNRAVLEVIVEHLLEFENLTGEDLLKLVKDYGGLREQEPFFLSPTNPKLISGGSQGFGKESGLSLLESSS